MMRIILVMLLLTSVAQAEQIRLRWTPPTHNADGSELTDLAGYRIYSRLTSEEEYTLLRSIPSDDIDTAKIFRLNVGEYWFTMTAYDSDHNESGYSNELLVSINTPPNPPGNVTVEIGE